MTTLTELAQAVRDMEVAEAPRPSILELFDSVFRPDEPMNAFQPRTLDEMKEIR